MLFRGEAPLSHSPFWRADSSEDGRRNAKRRYKIPENEALTLKEGKSWKEVHGCVSDEPRAKRWSVH